MTGCCQTRLVVCIECGGGMLGNPGVGVDYLAGPGAGGEDGAVPLHGGDSALVPGQRAHQLLFVNVPQLDETRAEANGQNVACVQMQMKKTKKFKHVFFKHVFFF